MVETEETLAVADQYPSQFMQAYPVGVAVGNVRNYGPELAESVGEFVIYFFFKLSRASNLTGGQHGREGQNCHTPLAAI